MSCKTTMGLTVLACTLASAPSFAESLDDANLSIGGALGEANADFKGLSDADNEPYFELFARFKFSNGFSVESTVVSFGTHESDDLIETEVEASGVTVQGGYFYEASELISLYARGGLLAWTAEAHQLQLSASGSGSLPTGITSSNAKVFDDDGLDLTVGIGIDFNINTHFSLGANIQHYKMDSNSMDTYAISGAYTF